METESRGIFDFHPAAVVGGLVAGDPAPGPAPEDAVAEPEPERRRALGRLYAAALRRRGECAVPGTETA